MAWSKDKPDNNGVIRSAPGEIRANWTEIEQNDTGVRANALNQWSVHLLNRNDAAVTGAETPTSIDEVGMLYCHDKSGTNQLYYQDGESTANQLQMTRSTEVTIAQNGQSFLPGTSADGAVLIQWFQVGIGTSTSEAVTFPTAFPTSCYNVTITAETNKTNARPPVIVAGTITTAGFTVANDSATSTTLHVQAIGI